MAIEGAEAMNHLTAGPTDPIALIPVRVLLVDDHDLGRRSLARLLEVMGYEVTAAADGASALEALRVGPGFDYLLTDVRLPDLDGREIVQIARQREPRPLIALITGWDIDPAECTRIGVDFLFLKPVDVQDLIAKLQTPRG